MNCPICKLHANKRELYSVPAVNQATECFARIKDRNEVCTQIEMPPKKTLSQLQQELKSRGNTAELYFAARA